MATELQIQLKQAGVGGKTLNLAEDESNNRHARRKGYLL